MSINVILTPEDMMGSDLQPGWYPLEVIKVEELPTKAGVSNNIWFHFKIIADGRHKNRELRRSFNEKYMNFGADLWKSLGLIGEKGGKLTDEMLYTAVGKKVRGYIKKDKEGKYDNLEQFTPLV